MTNIDIDRLVPHPNNSNRMNDDMLRTLSLHIERTDRYPSIIVRPHPTQENMYQVLDGHHRLLVLQQLGHARAQCQIWDVQDDEAVLLLLTLNRLEGHDDPQRRGTLFEQLRISLSLVEIAELVPEDQLTIEKLIDLTHAAPTLAPPIDADTVPQAVTFFLTEPQKQMLNSKLRAIDRDRSTALVRALELDSSTAEVCNG